MYTIQRLAEREVKKLKDSLNCEKAFGQISSNSINKYAESGD